MFFKRLSDFSTAPALIDDEGQYTYAQLQLWVEQWLQRLGRTRQLILLQFANTKQDVAFYLACLQGGHVAILAEPENAAQISTLRERYQPNWLYADGELLPAVQQCHTLAPSLRLLVSTSGSTGNAKQVALSDANLASNASAIAISLQIEQADTALSTLPFHYVYGLSVLNSHLHCGASVRLFNGSVTSADFWQILKQQPISSIAGVPFQYECLHRLRFLQRDYPSLRYMTQAGGKLNPDLVCAFANWARQHQKKFYVMYGQTEATARMSVNADPLAKPDSIGKAIAGGFFSLRDSEGNTIEASDQVGELIYEGDNVFCGYAHSVSELADCVPQQTLATGDLAKRDVQGDFYIVGRLSRFIKLFGKRINLADVESILAHNGFKAYALMGDDLLKLVCVGADKNKVTQCLHSELNIHPGYVKIKSREQIPLTSSGKPDYPCLQDWFNND